MRSKNLSVAHCRWGVRAAAGSGQGLYPCGSG
ncbi:hypothetical protein BSTP3_273 [Bacillus phage BSTP3]|nr:hypothetical protein BSTP3_273 [Bacillus phage BSTP3]